MSDDHAAHAISSYGSVINQTPQMDRIGREGMRFDNCFCTNSICAPSRAAILTGTYNHINGVTTLSTLFDSSQTQFPGLLQEQGYQTALYGKWHLGHGPDHDPQGFDDWQIFPGQGAYHDPKMIKADGELTVPGYATDIVTDLSLSWLEERDHDRPFCLLVHHKAPHRNWEPDAKHADLYADEDIPEPATFRDDYSERSAAAAAAKMQMSDLTENDVKGPVPEGLTDEQADSWRYQRYIKDYLRCIASVDDNVGRLLDYLDAEGLTENTLVIYTSDQGFFLGDHGWFDKRFIYEHSLRMPFLVRYPPLVPVGSINDDLVTNVDVAQTFLELAGVAAPDRMQGASLVPLLRGDRPDDWREAVYYRYWEHDDSAHAVWSHYGIRTDRHKLVYYYNDGLGLAGTSDRRFPPEWELFDLEHDPDELHNVIAHPEYAAIRDELTLELRRQQNDLGDAPHPEETPPG